MKKMLFLMGACLLMGITVSAQRYAIIETRYILDKLPDYKEAQAKLDGTANMWQKEIDNKQLELDKMYRDVEAEKVMLPDELKNFVLQRDIRIIGMPAADQPLTGKAAHTVDMRLHDRKSFLERFLTLTRVFIQEGGCPHPF